MTTALHHQGKATMTDERAEFVKDLRTASAQANQEFVRKLLLIAADFIESQAVAGEAEGATGRYVRWHPEHGFEWGRIDNSDIGDDLQLGWKSLQLYTTPQPAPVDAAVEMVVLSKDLYQVLMDVQNRINSPARMGMANSAIRMIDKARTAFAAQQKESGS